MVAEAVAEVTQTSPPATEAAPPAQDAELAEGASLLKEVGLAGDDGTDTGTPEKAQAGTDTKAKTEPPIDKETEAYAEAKAEAARETERARVTEEKDRETAQQEDRAERINVWEGRRRAYAARRQALEQETSEFEPEIQSRILGAFDAHHANAYGVAEYEVGHALVAMVAELLPGDMRRDFIAKADQAVRDEAIRPSNQNLTLAFLKDFKTELEKAARNGYLSKVESKAEAARAAVVTRNFYRQHPELLNSQRAAPEAASGVTANGGNSYLQMTPEQRAQLTPEQRDRLIALNRR